MKISIIGAGVIGLTSAITLQEAGHEVTIFAKEFSPNTTSNVAAAIWYPYKVGPVDKVEKWGEETFRYYQNLSKDLAAGIVWRELLEYGEGKVITKTRTLPFVDTTVHIDYLINKAKSAGAKFIQKTLSSIDEIGDEFLVVVNCSGLGARELVNDSSMYAIRGQVVRAEGEISASDKGFVYEQNHAATYFFPRLKDFILGGTADENQEDLTVSQTTTDAIVERNKKMFPLPKNLKVIESKVGLRPGRKEVRLEKQKLPDGKVVIHNYGHGGAGFTLCWGCAREVLNLLSALD